MKFDSVSLQDRPTPTVGTARWSPRIALFSGNYNYVRDGANQALNRLVAHLEQEIGAHVRIYSPTTRTPAFEPAGTLVSVPSIGFPGRRDYRLATGFQRRIRADLAAFAPDLVHLSAPDILGTKALGWAKTRGLTVVTSLHTRFETYFSYYGLGFVRHWAERHLASFYSRSDFVLVPTQSILEEMLPGRTDDRIRLWSRGVDRELFDPVRRDYGWRRTMGIADDEVALLFFGRLVLEKGVDSFIAISRALGENGLRTRPLIVGDGPARQRLASALPNAVFTGYLSGIPLARAIASADIMINPSVTEAFGNVVLEGLASGIAVISADAPSARAMVAHGENGLLCPPRCPAAYISAASRLIRSPEERHALSAAARETSASYSWDTALDAVIAVYREALGERAADRSLAA